MGAPMMTMLEQVEAQLDRHCAGWAFTAVQMGELIGRRPAEIRASLAALKKRGILTAEVLDGRLTISGNPVMVYTKA